MNDENRVKLLNMMDSVYQTPSTLEQYIDDIPPLLAELVSTAPEGLQGMAKMIGVHFSHAIKLKDAKVQHFELESGLIKYQTYLRKLSHINR